MKYRCKYEYFRRFGIPTHVWTLVGAKGGLHLHIRGSSTPEGSEMMPRFYGGVEVHLRQPRDSRNADPPTHDCCDVIKSPCWSHGSSMAADRFIEIWKDDPHEHDDMFARLSILADEMLASEDDDAGN